MRKFPALFLPFKILIICSLLLLASTSIAQIQDIIIEPDGGNKKASVAEQIGYEPSIACFTKAISIEPQIGEYYNLACAYALNLNIDKAFDTLQLAVEMGFNSKSQIESDPDLTALKNDERWGILLGKMK
jgi:tetratricopeptide (TPR) repeat protein